MKLSIVTPSFNQGRFLDTCIRSILDQEYPDLEYFVMDGGSADGSPEIIRRYADRLTGWRSQPDGGHMDAVQEGFARSTGEVMGWLNSDDMLAPWALRVVAEVFRCFPEVEWITSLYPMVMNENGLVAGARRSEGFNAKAFYRGRNAPFSPWFYSSMIQQESTFWRRGLWEKAGSRVDSSLRVAGDFELWSRFFEHSELCALAVPLGIFRFQPESFTARDFEGYMEVCRRVLAQYSHKPPSPLESLARRVARELPDRWQPLTGLAYPVSHIVRSTGDAPFEIRKAWIL
ncbi:MAG: glycosyltransferase [Anaerolineales bacterium]|nr:glycosyltransferase [Anaerolineales bacterium]